MASFMFTPQSGVAMYILIFFERQCPIMEQSHEHMPVIGHDYESP